MIENAFDRSLITVACGLLTISDIGPFAGLPQEQSIQNMQVFLLLLGATALLVALAVLAGNLTVLGSVANLIVVEQARREGVAISFWDYGKVGIPLTILTLALGIAWLEWVRY